MVSFASLRPLSIDSDLFLSFSYPSVLAVSGNWAIVSFPYENTWIIINISIYLTTEHFNMQINRNPAAQDDSPSNTISSRAPFPQLQINPSWIDQLAWITSKPDLLPIPIPIPIPIPMRQTAEKRSEGISKRNETHVPQVSNNSLSPMKNEAPKPRLKRSEKHLTSPKLSSVGYHSFPHPSHSCGVISHPWSCHILVLSTTNQELDSVASVASVVIGAFFSRLV